MNLLNRMLYSPINVQMVVTRRCNLSCSYCNEYDNKSSPVPLGQLKSQIDKLRELGTFSLAFTGGEPLLHPNLDEVISYAKKNIFNVGIITNGFLLTEERIAALNAAHLDWVQLSIDGVKKNKSTMKVLDNLGDKVNLLKKHARFMVNINAVIGPTSSGEVMSIIDFSKNRGFSTTIGLVHDGNGALKLDKQRREEYLLANQKRKRNLFELRNYEKEFIEKGIAPFRCRAGSRYLYIDESGDVHWCSQKRKGYAKPLSQYSERDLASNFYTKKNCSDYCTVGCVRRSSVLDEFRRQDKEMVTPKSE